MSKKKQYGKDRGRRRFKAPKHTCNEESSWPPPWDFQLMPISEMDFDQLIAMDAYYNPF